MNNELGVLINFGVVYVGNPPTDECPKYVGVNPQLFLVGVNQKWIQSIIPMGVKCKIDR